MTFFVFHFLFFPSLFSLGWGGGRIGRVGGGIQMWIQAKWSRIRSTEETKNPEFSFFLCQLNYGGTASWIPANQIFNEFYYKSTKPVSFSLLSFSKQIVILSWTVKVALRHLAYFSVISIIIFLARFDMFGMLAFGSVTESYFSILYLCVFQFKFVLGKAVPKMAMNQVCPPLAFLYFTLCISYMTVVISQSIHRHSEFFRGNKR